MTNGVKLTVAIDQKPYWILVYLRFNPQKYCGKEVIIMINSNNNESGKLVLQALAVLAVAIIAERVIVKPLDRNVQRRRRPSNGQFARLILS